MKTSGIYKIVNKVNGKYYVGSSNDVNSNVGRFYEHKAMFRRKDHHNEHLQSAWYKHGEESFEFIVVEQCSSDRETLLACEQKYLDIAKNEPNKTYNKSFVAGCLDMTEEICKKISKAKKGKFLGKDNPNYIEIPKNIINKAKNVWIKKGRTSLFEFMKPLGYKMPTCDRLIEEFKRDKKAYARRKINFSKNHRKFAKHIPDKTIYTFKNLNTSEIYSGTRKDFSLSHPNDKCIHPLIIGRVKKYKGWILVSPKTI